MATINQLDKKIDQLTDYIVNGGLIENLKEVFVTKADFTKVMNDISTKLDAILVIVSRLDQERLFMVQRMDRLESEVEKIKKVLKIA